MILKRAANLTSANRPGEGRINNRYDPTSLNETTEAQGGGRGKDHEVGFAMPATFNRATFEVAGLNTNSDEE